MEKIQQTVGRDGLQIPSVVMRQYGLDSGATVTLELEADSIRISPTRLDRTAIENRALRYLLKHVGDAVSIEAEPLPDGAGWRVNVYGAGQTMLAGTLVYSPSGVLGLEQSTPATQIRQVMMMSAVKST